MKKFLVFVLAIMMVLANTVLAAPVMVGTVENGEEAGEVVPAEVEASAEVMADEANLIYHISFDNLAEGAFAQDTKVPMADLDVNGGANAPASFSEKAPAFYVRDKANPTISDGVMTFTPSDSNYHRFHFYPNNIDNVGFPVGDYTLKVKVKPDANVNFRLFVNNGMTAAGPAIGASASQWKEIEMNFTVKKGINPSTGLPSTNAWYNIVTSASGTQELGTTKLESVGFAVNSSNAKWDIDYVKIYFTPHTDKEYTVTFDANGKDVAPIEAAVVPAGVSPTLDLSGYKMDDVSDTIKFAGWSTTPDGEVVDSVDVMKVSKLYAVWMEVEENILYHFTFDNAEWNDVNATLNTAHKIKDYGLAAVNVAPAALDGFTFRAGGNASVADGVLKFTAAGGWARWRIETQGAKFPAGNYTVKFDMTATAMNGSVWTFAFITPSENSACSQAINTGHVTLNQKTTRTYTFSVDADGKVTSGGSTSANSANAVFFAASGGTSTFSIDDIKLYYQALTDKEYTITFNANGGKADNFTAVIPAGSMPTLNVSGYTMDGGTSKLAGWATTPDGEVVTSVDITKVTTLYAVWDEHYYPAEKEDLNAGNLYATIDFNTVTKVTADNDIISFGLAEPKESFPDFVFCNPGETSRQRLFLHINGSHNLTALNGVTGKDNDIVLSNSRNAGTVDNYSFGVTCTKSYSAWSSEFKDGIYTLAAELFIEENENFENANSYCYAKYNDGGGADGQPTAGYTDLPIGEKTYVKKSILVKDGKVYDYDSMRPMGNGVDAGKLVSLAIGVAINHKEDATGTITGFVHYDNFKVFYTPNTGSLKSFAENSIRTDENKGIRFKSSVAKTLKEDANTTEYGFIVTRKSLLVSVAPNEFTKESGVTYVSGVSYNKADGTDKIYAEDDYRVDFTGVITGMPASKANYTEELVVRPYVVYNGVTTYGDAMVRSVYDTALALRAADYLDMDEDGIAEVDKIITICEAA